jgi:hypothetical protein
VDPNPKPKLTILCKLSIPIRELFLPRDGALNGVHGTRELGQYTVPGGVGDPAAVFGDESVHDLARAAKARSVPTSSWLIRRE